jgi:hypothetical protein
MLIQHAVPAETIAQIYTHGQSRFHSDILSSWSTSAMGLLSPKYVVLGILCGYPATEVDLLIPFLPAREYRFESGLRHQRANDSSPSTGTST